VTTFVFNGLGQRVQEKLNGTVIKLSVWAGGAQPAEERDGANNVTKRFYAQGEQVGGTSSFFTDPNRDRECPGTSQRIGRYGDLASRLVARVLAVTQTLDGMVLREASDLSLPPLPPAPLPK
jgi:hypothetical protein